MEYNAIRLECMEQLRRADGESGLSHVARLRAFLDNRSTAARSQWTGRRTWSTHTYPGGCWICDLIAIATVALKELEKYADTEELDRIEQDNMAREIEEELRQRGVIFPEGLTVDDLVKLEGQTKEEGNP